MRRKSLGRTLEGGRDCTPVLVGRVRPQRWARTTPPGKYGGSRVGVQWRSLHGHPVGLTRRLRRRPPKVVTTVTNGSAVSNVEIET